MKKMIQIMTICFLSFLSFKSINAQSIFLPFANTGIDPTGTSFIPTTPLDLNQTAQNMAYGIGGQTVLQNWGIQ